MNYYEHHLGDYLRDTAHLSMLEDGAYRRLLDAYYIREAPLPVTLREVHRLVRAITKQDREAVETVLREFFTETPNGWTHRRCDQEIERFQDKQRKAKASADARWSQSGRNANASADAPANASADAMRTHSEGNAPRARPQSPDTSHQPLQAELAGVGDSAPSAAPPPPPDFDGVNAETLNGKAVVPLAAAWELPEQWGLDAEALGWKPAEVVREAEKFRQYWTAGNGAGHRRSVKGWRQTWSNWLAKAAERRR